MDRGEKSHKSQGLIGSLVFHAAILAIFFFFVLNTPNPPLADGGSGIELNYGNFEEGSGDLQTLNTPGNDPSKEPNTTTEPLPAETTLPPADPTPIESEPLPQEEEMVLTDNPEDVALETKKVEQPKEIKEKIKEPEKVEKPEKIKEPEKTDKTEKKAEVVPAKTKPIDKNIQPVKSASDGKPGTVDAKGGGNNNGDREGKVGDQGNPEGNLNAKALYGNPGEGGDGSGGTGGNKLDMTGWKLAFKLEKKDITNENGKIVYQIKVDDKGELVSIIPIEKTVSPVVEKFYRQQIEDNWAVDRTKDNTNPPPIATGKYTVFVRSK